MAGARHHPEVDTDGTGQPAAASPAAPAEEEQAVSRRKAAMPSTLHRHVAWRRRHRPPPGRQVYPTEPTTLAAAQAPLRRKLANATSGARWRLQRDRGHRSRPSAADQEDRFEELGLLPDAGDLHA